MQKIYMLVFAIMVCMPALSLASEVEAEKDQEQAMTPPRSAVVSAHPLATKAGYDILAQGGNAYDAAVAVAAALGVVEPFGSGLGGGGFWLLYKAHTKEYLTIDAREKAPLDAHADMYLDADGAVIEGASQNGPLAAGIPGQAAALVSVNERFGVLPLPQVLAPAIKLAREGFAVSERYRAGVQHKLDVLKQYPDSAAIFLDDGRVPEAGWLLVQEDLAQTLDSIAAEGRNGFYNGDVAQKLVDAVQNEGGIWRFEDLKAYQTVDREPVVTDYKDATLIMPPLPSSGGLVIGNILNILKGYDLAELEPATRKHYIIEAMKHGYYNRALYMGDSDFSDVPVEKILSTEMAAEQRKKISSDTVRTSASFPPVISKIQEGDNTTHFSILDEKGNRVAVTQSINFWFGSGFVAEGTGVLLNNEMDDFTTKPGAANGYGLVGTQANAIEPEKRMLSSMTPLFIEAPHGIAIIGTPGGSRIISMNLLSALEFVEGASPARLVSAPRYHHQFLPDEVVYEPKALSEDEIKALQEKGHVLRESSRRYGNMQAIYWDYQENKVQTFSDPRGHGTGRVY